MIQSVTYGGIVFKIESKDNSLVKMFKEKSGSIISEVFIPHIFPSGERIDFLEEMFNFNNWLDKVVIDDDITVRNKAFREAHIKEIVWPANCTTIPSYCFLDSDVEKVTNTHNVTEIEECAFKWTKISEFDWPPGCQTIPKECFLLSAIKKLSNTNHITEVGQRAFASCNIRQFEWPPMCKKIPAGCFQDSSLKGISNIENIEIIDVEAFSNVSPEFSVDLSQTPLIGVGKGAFAFCDEANIALPYYTSGDAFYEWNSRA